MIHIKLQIDKTEQKIKNIRKHKEAINFNRPEKKQNTNTQK